MTRLNRAGWLSLACLLAVGCAMSPEDPTGAQPESEAAQDEPAPATEMVAPDPSAVGGEAGERNLVDLQRELANNEAKLQALGVVLPSRTIAGGDGLIGAEKPDAMSEPQPKAESEPPRAGGGASTKSDDRRPSPAPSSREDGKGKDGRKPKPKKAESTAVPGGFAPRPPEEAKSTPLSPNEQPQLDAATRCSQVCSLSDITCELGVQICELAQRHADNEEYEQACVRATEDCDAAQEACDACTQ